MTCVAGTPVLTYSNVFYNRAEVLEDSHQKDFRSRQDTSLGQGQKYIGNYCLEHHLIASGESKWVETTVKPWKAGNTDTAKLKTETYTHHTQREKHAHLSCTHTGLSILLLLGRAAAQNTSLPCPSADNSALESQPDKSGWVALSRCFDQKYVLTSECLHHFQVGDIFDTAAQVQVMPGYSELKPSAEHMGKP